MFTYQEALTLLAAYLGGVLTDSMIGEISAVGGMLIMGLGVVKGLWVANYLPALLIAPLVDSWLHNRSTGDPRLSCLPYLLTSKSLTGCPYRIPMGKPRFPPATPGLEPFPILTGSLSHRDPEGWKMMDK